jgi:flagellar M-ring protein FliF
MESQPGLMRTMAVGICGFLLVLFVLRPMARQVTETLRRPQPLLTSGANLGTVLAKEQERMLPPEPDWRSEEEDAAAPLPVMTRAQRQQQGIFEHVSEHIRRDPAQSTRLLEGWIGSSEEGR